MNMTSTKTLISFSLLDGLYWAFASTFTGFIATYLLECGMSNSFLSIVLAVFMGCSFAGSFFWGSKCDKCHTNRKIFLFEYAAAVILSIVIFFMAKVNLWIAAGLYPIFGFLYAPLGSNLDAWMIKSFNHDSGKYGKARSVGSMGWAIAALIIGFLISSHGYIVMPIGIVLFALPVLILAYVMNEPEYGGEPEHIEKVSTAGLIKIKPYIYMIIILFLTGLACAPINNLKIVFIKAVGGNVSILGVDSFIGVTIQAIFIFLSGRLRKIPSYVRMSVMTVCVVLDLLLILLATTPFMIIFGSVMWNASYGIMLPTVRELTEKNVNGALKNTAHSMSDAMYGSFAGIIALTYSGIMLDEFGAKFVALLGIIVMLAPVMMAVIGMLREKNE